MKTLRICAAMLIGLSLTACGSVETATRNTPLDLPMAAAAPSQVTVNRVQVNVPRSLRASEANRYFPSGDIVWRGDPRGDRHAQVQAIFEDAMTRGVTGLSGTKAVDLDIEVMRFHALTEKARYTVGGVHALTFQMTLRDPATGAALSEPRVIKANLKGFGGSEAIEAEARGETQKVRITRHLANVIRTEITNPGGYKQAELGLMGMIDKIGS